MLTKVKDTLAMEKLSKVVYWVLCSWQGLHWGDSEETWNQSEGALGCLPEGGTGEVGACTAFMGEPPTDQVGGNHSGWPGQEPQAAIAEGGNPHPVAQIPPLNRDGRLELPGCWMAALKGMEGRAKQRQPATSDDMLQPEVTCHFQWHTLTKLPVIANDETHGYKWQVLSLASLLLPRRRPEHLIETSARFQPCCEAGIGELPFSSLSQLRSHHFMATLLK